MRLALSYSFFALLATIANILTQDIAIRLYAGTRAILVSIMLGTIVGLVTKYVLDKQFIFKYTTTGIRQESRAFFLYTVMGVLTTAIFWGSELAFHYLFGTRELRYLGGILGLAIGYWLKYHLDKRYVFCGIRA